MYDRILIPLDGSALAEAAVPVANLIPSRLVYLLNVEPDEPVVTHEIDATGHEARRQTLFQTDGEHLARVAESFREQGREVEVIRIAGAPAERIVETAADVDLIVMATHGRGGTNRAFLGSVTDQVARAASAPTLIVRGSYRPASPPLTRVLVPLDGSPLAEEALPVAATLANELDLRVHLVRVLTPPRMWSSASSLRRSGERAEQATASDEQAERTYLEEQAQRLSDQDVVVSHELRSGPAIPSLRTAIRPRDIVVMTTHGRHGVRRLVLGSIADALIRQASAPILLVRAGMAVPSRY